MNYRADFHSPFSFVGTDIAEIGNDNWDYKNVPVSKFQMAYVENFGFIINMFCDEKNPVRNFKHCGENAFMDSCFEFFVNFAPEKSNKYMNFEFSAGGAILAGVGESRFAREQLTDFYENHDVSVSVRDDGWDVTAFIPNELIFSVYGKIDFKSGYSFRANFYKCCEEEGRKHFVSWSPIIFEKPEFHCPDQFGYVTLDKSIDNI